MINLFLGVWPEPFMRQFLQNMRPQPKKGAKIVQQIPKSTEQDMNLVKL